MQALVKYHLVRHFIWVFTVCKNTCLLVSINKKGLQYTVTLKTSFTLFSVITCDPPAPIAHTEYTPNNVTEHNWNTSIHYSCHDDYHYVSGVSMTTCNETGVFPPVDFNCSGNTTRDINLFLFSNDNHYIEDLT